jgi:ATP-binding cassette subfamily C protein
VRRIPTEHQHRRDRSSFPALLRRCLLLATGGSHSSRAALASLALLVSAIEAAGAALLVSIVRLAIDPSGPWTVPPMGDLRRHVSSWADRDVILAASLVAGALFVVRGCLVIGQEAMRARVTEEAGARLAERLHHGYLAVPFDEHVTRGSARQLRDGTETVHELVREVFYPATALLAEVPVLIALGAFLLVTSPTATAVAVAVVVPVGLVLNRVVHPRLQALGRQSHELAEVNLRELQESVAGLPEIRLLGREAHFEARFAATRRRLARVRSSRHVLRRLPAVGLETTLVGFVVIFLATATSSTSADGGALPVLAVFAYVSLRTRPSIDAIAQAVSSIRSSAPAVDDLERELGNLERSQARRALEPIVFASEIRFDDVHVRYLGSTSDALSGVSLTIRRGEHLGVMGTTGGGKTTMVHALVGLLTPHRGTVLVDGVDINRNLRSWQDRLGLVSQHPYLLDDTLRRNIAFGLPDEDIDEALVEQVVDLARLDNLTRALPDGLDSRVGERGVQLSGGERQRLAIARALYRRPDVLVLDESTAALDLATEASLLDALLGEARTIVTVAHRLSSVRRCDRLVVLEAGRVTATGSHEDLLATSAAFRALATIDRSGSGGRGPTPLTPGTAAEPGTDERG